MNENGPLTEVITAYLQAVDSGQTPNQDEVLARHPELTVELQRFFATQDRVREMTEPLRPEAAFMPRRFGDYQVLEEIGRGGMGVVYRARQESLGREVAVKILLGGAPARQGRLRQEAEVLARLDHPGIVPVHEVGVTEGQAFFVMKLVEGASLASRRDAFRADVPRAVRLVVAVARALHYAHEKGVVHRDLKPANILLDAGDTPYVTDFGLAKRLEEDAQLSASGVVVGTPAYMAPEQVENAQAIGAAADVWALGVILYELLTGKLPFQAKTILDTLRQVMECEPRPPRQLDGAVHPDLEVICLKCLDKRPSHRYASAAALADDLERWLKREPIEARRVGRVERLKLWCRRKPVLAGLGGLAAALLVLAGGLVVANWWQQRKLHVLSDEKAELDLKRKKADELARQARESQQALEYRKEMRQAARLAEAENLADVVPILDKWQPKADGEKDHRASEWHLLHALASRDSLVRPEELDDYPDDEVYTTLPGKRVGRIDWSPDGRYLYLAGYFDNSAAIMEVKTGKTILSRKVLAIDSPSMHSPGTHLWSPDGKFIALVMNETTVEVLEVPSGKAVLQVSEPTLKRPELSAKDKAERKGEGPSTHLSLQAWSSDGMRLTIGTRDHGEIRNVEVFNVKTGVREASWKDRLGPVRELVWSSDDQYCASLGKDGEIVLQRATSGDKIAVLTTPEQTNPQALSWRPGRNWLAFGCFSKKAGADRVIVLDVEKRAAVLELPMKRTGIIWSLDGKRLAGGFLDAGEPAMCVVDVETGRTLFTGQGNPDKNLRRAHIWHRSVSEVHQHVVSIHELQPGTGSRIAIPWRIEPHSPFGLEGGRPENTTAAAWSPDGRRLALASSDGRIQVRNVPQDTRRRTLHLQNIEGLSWHPQGRRLLTVSKAAHFRDWSKINFHELPLSATEKANRVSWPPVSTGRFWGLREKGRNDPPLLLSPDGKRLAYPADDGRICIGNVADGQLLTEMGGHGGTPDHLKGLLWSPRGERLASCSDADDSLIVWNAATGERLVTFPGMFGTRPMHWAWAPDGSHLALRKAPASTERRMTMPQTIEVCEIPSGRRVLQFAAPGDGPLAWSPDGKYLAANGTVWEAATGKKVALIDGELEKLASQFGNRSADLQWSPDGKRLAWLVGPLLHDGKTEEIKAKEGPRERTRERTQGGLFDLAASKTIPFQLAGERPNWSSLLWAPDSLHVALLNGCQKIWNPLWDKEEPPDGCFAIGAMDARTGLPTEELKECKPDGRVRVQVWTAEGVLGSAGPRESVPDPEKKAPRSESSENRPRVVNVTTGKEVHVGEKGNPVQGDIEVMGFDNQLAMAWSRDGERVALAIRSIWGRTGPEILILNPRTGKEEKRLSIPDTRFDTGDRFDWSPDGRKLAITKRIGAVGPILVEIWDVDAGKVLHTMTILETDSDVSWARQIAWSPDGSRIAVAASRRSSGGPFSVTIVIAGTWAKERTLSTGKNWSYDDFPGIPLAWSPDGRYLVGPGNPLPVWEVATGKQAFSLLGHEGRVEAVAWSPGGERILSRAVFQTRKVSEQRETRVWDGATGEEVIAIRGAVAQLSPAPDSRTMAFHSRRTGKDLFVWDLAPPRKKLPE